MNPLLPVMDRIVYLAGGRAASGTTDEVVRAEVLSALYGYEVDVHVLHGRILVVAGPMEADHDAGPSSGPGARGGLIVHWIFEPGFFSSHPVHVAFFLGAVVAVFRRRGGFHRHPRTVLCGSRTCRCGHRRRLGRSVASASTHCSGS